MILDLEHLGDTDDPGFWVNALYGLFPPWGTFSATQRTSHLERELFRLHTITKLLQTQLDNLQDQINITYQIENKINVYVSKQVRKVEAVLSQLTCREQTG